MQKNTTVHDGVEAFLAFRKARFAATTVQNDGHVLRRFARTFGPARQVRYLTAQDIEDWFYGPDGVMNVHRTRDRKQRPPVQPSTHNFYRTRLNMLFVFWTKRGLLKVDLLLDVQPIKVVRKQRQQPGPEVLLGLLDRAANPRDRAYLATAMNTGLRQNEILRLRVRDVDLDQGSLFVFISKSKVEDALPITADLAAELRRWLTRYAADLPVRLSGEHYLFPALSGNRFRKCENADGTWSTVNESGRWVPGKPMSHPERVVQAALSSAGLPTKGEGNPHAAAGSRPPLLRLPR